MQSVSMYEGDFIMEKNLEMKSRKKVVSMIHLLFFFHHFRRDTAVTNPHLFPFYRLSFAYQFQMNHHRNKKTTKSYISKATQFFSIT